MFDIDLAATPRTVKNEFPMPIANADAALCDQEGVKVFVGPEYYPFQSPRVLAVAKIHPAARKISPEKFGCEV